jgi:hypothetical protein
MALTIVIARQGTCRQYPCQRLALQAPAPRALARSQEAGATQRQGGLAERWFEDRSQSDEFAGKNPCADRGTIRPIPTSLRPSRGPIRSVAEFSNSPRKGTGNSGLLVSIHNNPVHRTVIGMHRAWKIDRIRTGIDRLEAIRKQIEGR